MLVSEVRHFVGYKHHLPINLFLTQLSSREHITYVV